MLDLLRARVIESSLPLSKNRPQYQRLNIPPRAPHIQDANSPAPDSLKNVALSDSLNEFFGTCSTQVGRLQ